MPLTTLSKVKEFLAETSTGLDTPIASLITSVGARIASYTGRARLDHGSVSDEVHDGDTSRYAVILREWPVTAVSAVVVNGETLGGTESTVDSSRGILTRTPVNTWSPVPWPEGRRNIVVSYNAGYDTIPSDLEYAATVQVAWDLKRSGHKGGRLGERSQTIGDGTAVYMVDAWAPEVLSILSVYRRVTI